LGESFGQASGAFARRDRGRIFGVIARLDRAPSIPETAVIESMSRGVMDAPLSRSMTVFVRRQSGMLPVSEDEND
jgi:hypothetical protein